MWSLNFIHSKILYNYMFFRSSFVSRRASLSTTSVIGQCQVGIA